MRQTFTRRVVGLLIALLFLFAAVPAMTSAAAPRTLQGTPTSTFSCDTATSAGATPAIAGMNMGTPVANVEFDQLYIDMMIPHHASIIALSQAALPRLKDGRLRTIAQAIIKSQSAEIPELRSYREQFYGSPEPAPLDMAMMHELMPNMSMQDMEAMMTQMDPAAEVARFCAAPDPDLAFIDMTIPHHRSAVVASQTALQRAVHPEIKQFAQGVIKSQQAEIDELTAIRQDLYGAATPTS